MATETPSRVNVMEYAGKEYLLDLDRAERAEFYKLLAVGPSQGASSRTRSIER